MTFKIKKLTAKIVHLQFEDPRLMSMTMLRFQEFFESPKFRGRIFSLNEFKVWYKKKNRTNRFTYYSDWWGFNFPAKILTPFKKGLFGKLSKQEILFLEKMAFLDEESYIISTSKKHNDVQRHEQAHAFYFTDASYKIKVDKILDLLPRTEYPKKQISLLNSGYHESVLHDELHAYLLENCGETWDDLTKSLKLEKEFSDKELIIYKKVSSRLSKNLDLYLSRR